MPLLPIVSLLLSLLLPSRLCTASAVEVEKSGQQRSGAEVAAELLLPPRRADLTCSACKLTAGAIRAALVERMPKRVKSASKRRELATAALAETGENGTVCDVTRFPKETVITGATKDELVPCKIDTERCRAQKQIYNDMVVIRGREGEHKNWHRLLHETTQGALDDIIHVCETLTSSRGEEIIKRAEAHKGRIFGAVSDRFLCRTVAPICSGADAPVGGNDEDWEEEDEL